MTLRLPDELRDRWMSRKGPTAREMHGLRGEFERHLAEHGHTVPFMPEDIETRGLDWWREIEGRWTMPEPTPGEIETTEGNRELLELLLCPACDMELYTPPCSPVHALLQDSPGQHRLLIPIVEAAIYSIRHEQTRICNVCPGNVPVAQGDCPHVVDRFGQVWMSKKIWEEERREVVETRHKLAEQEELHNAYIDSVALERKRAEDDRAHWAAGWALDKIERLAEDMDMSGEAPSRAFLVALTKMLTEDL